MAWFKVDDHLWSHPKFGALSDAAQALWLRSGSYSAEKLSDGAIDTKILNSMLRAKPKVVAELIESGLWLRTTTGIQFHDWLEYQPSGDSVRREREHARERMANVRANKRRSSDFPGPGPGPDPQKADHEDPIRSSELSSGSASVDPFIEESAQVLGIRNFPRVKAALSKVVAVSDAVAVDLARALLLLASNPVQSPEAYIEVCCRESKDRVLAEYRLLIERLGGAA